MKISINNYHKVRYINWRKDLQSVAKWYLSLAFLLLTIVVSGQKSTARYQLYKNIIEEARFLTTDKLQQCYLVNNQNDLIKYNPAGIEVFRYSNNKLGQLEAVDVSNPFHILLYYPEFGNIITLDRTLNETSTRNLFDLGVLQTQAVGVSFDNNIWVFDELANRLRKYDKQGKIVIESIDLSTVIQKRIQPTNIIENNNQVYLYDPESGLYFFDIFGQFIRSFEVPNLSTLQIKNGHLLGVQDFNLFIWQLATGIKHPVELPFELQEEMQLRIEQNHLFVLEDNTTSIYRK